MLKQKQIDNLSKYCYDVSKLVMGLAVIGNFLSNNLSMTALGIGLSCTLIFLIFGHLLDRLEVNKNDQR